MTAVEIDVTLLEQRTVIASVADDSGIGYVVRLTCGHCVWCAVNPIEWRMRCAICLEHLIHQIRMIQAHQEPR